MRNGEVTVDLSNYRDRVGSRVAPGRYRVAVEDAEQSQAKSGNQMITLWLRILDGEHAGSTVIDRLVLSENSLFRVVGFLQALGIPTPKKRIMFNLRSFVGRTLEVDIEDGDPYMGKIKSEVRGYNKVKADESGVPADLGGGLDSALDALEEPEGGDRVAAFANSANEAQQSDDGAVDLASLEL